MTWEIVAAALRSAGIAATLSYTLNERSIRAADERSKQERAHQLALQREQYAKEREREETLGRTESRREILVPLRESLARLLVLPSRFR